MNQCISISVSVLFMDRIKLKIICCPPTFARLNDLRWQALLPCFSRTLCCLGLHCLYYFSKTHMCTLGSGQCTFWFPRSLSHIAQLWQTSCSINQNMCVTGQLRISSCFLPACQSWLNEDAGVLLPHLLSTWPTWNWGTSKAYRAAPCQDQDGTGLD